MPPQRGCRVGGPAAGPTGGFVTLYFTNGRTTKSYSRAPDDFGLQKGARPQRLRVCLRKIHDRVDFGRLTRQPAPPDELVLGGGAVDHHLDVRADAPLLCPRDDALLLGHQRVAALLLERRRHVVGEIVRGRAFLVRVGEDADVVEADVADERAQLARTRRRSRPGNPR